MSPHVLVLPAVVRNRNFSDSNCATDIMRLSPALLVLAVVIILGVCSGQEVAPQGETLAYARALKPLNCKTAQPYCLQVVPALCTAHVVMEQLVEVHLALQLADT